MRINEIYKAGLVLLIGLSISCNQSIYDSHRIVVIGIVSGYESSSVDFSFNRYELLSSQETSRVAVGEDGSFEVVLESESPLKGFISFGKVPRTYDFDITLVDGRDSSLSVGSVDFRSVMLFLEPGDSLVLEVDVNQIEKTLLFSGIGAENNEFVNQEEFRFNQYRDKFLGNYYDITYREPNDYLIVVDQLFHAKLDFLDQFRKDHPISDQLYKLYQADYQAQVNKRKIYYPDAHAGFNNDMPVDLPEDYYSFLNEVILSDNISDKGVNYLIFINSWLREKYDLQTEDSKQSYYQYIDVQLERRQAFELKAWLLGRDFSRELYEQFGAGCPFPDLAILVKEKYQHLEGMLPGSPAPEFILEDVDGDIVSLNDFKGKYVYIDFWATWCIPCIKEIPFLQEIEKTLDHDKIQFISISYDNEGDRTKWTNFIKEKGLIGIQLLADEETNKRLSNALNIKSIPRFVFIDPEGKIINANAPRPSDPDLKQLFDKYGL